MHPAYWLPVHREDDIRAHQRTQSTTGAIAFRIRRFHRPISTGIESVATHAEHPSWTCRHAQFATFAPVYIDDHRTLDHACHLLGTAITGLLRLSPSPDGHERAPAARGRRKAEAKYSQKAGSRLDRHLCRDDPVYLLPPQAKITPAFVTQVWHHSRRIDSPFMPPPIRAPERESENPAGPSQSRCR
jgi:hypothetical protein